MQHDYNIENQTALNFRSDVNSALSAIVSTNAGTEPTSMFAYMLWYDTASDTLKMRDETNSVWISIGSLDQTEGEFTPSGVTELSQVEVEDDSSTVFGQVSGERLSQAVAANISPPVWEQVVLYDSATDGTAPSSVQVDFEDGYEYRVYGDRLGFNVTGSLGVRIKMSDEATFTDIATIFSFWTGGGTENDFFFDLTDARLPMAGRLIPFWIGEASDTNSTGRTYGELTSSARVLSVADTQSTRTKVDSLRFYILNSQKISSGRIYILRREVTFE